MATSVDEVAEKEILKWNQNTACAQSPAVTHSVSETGSICHGDPKSEAWVRLTSKHFSRASYEGQVTLKLANSVYLVMYVDVRAWGMERSSGIVTWNSFAPSDYIRFSLYAVV